MNVLFFYRTIDIQV